MLKFRPHHFLCTLGFEGKGYSPSFVENYARIASELRDIPAQGDSVMIEVVAGSDSVCAPCPNRRGDSCATEDKISTLDRNHTAAHGIGPGQTISWGEAKARMARHMTVQAHHQACAPCSWRSLGVCESALMRLIGQFKENRTKWGK